MELILTRLKELLVYDKDVKGLRWIKKNSNASKLYGPAGWLSHGYRRIRIDKIEYTVHSLVWFYHYGKFPSNELDHINRIRDNNVLENLREVTHQQNAFNLPIMKHNKSGTPGVCYDKWGSRWRAYHHSTSRRKYLGSFKSKKLAIGARKKYEARLELILRELENESK